MLFRSRGNFLNCKLMVGSGGSGIPTYIAKHVLEDKTRRGRGKLVENLNLMIMEYIKEINRGCEWRLGFSEWFDYVSLHPQDVTNRLHLYYILSCMIFWMITICCEVSYLYIGLLTQLFYLTYVGFLNIPPQT